MSKDEGKRDENPAISAGLALAIIFAEQRTSPDKLNSAVAAIAPTLHEYDATVLYAAAVFLPFAIAEDRGGDE